MPEGERLRMREKQRKAPVLIGDGQLHHCHNHQHPKGLWKRQILPRPALATLQLSSPGPQALGSWGWGGGGEEPKKREG